MTNNRAISWHRRPATRYIVVIILMLVVGFGVREVIRWRYTQKMIDHVSQFTPVPGLDYYEETRPQFFAGQVKPFSHAVLLLHGYSGSPQEFDVLTAKLQEAGIPYYAPLMTGFGLNDFRLLYEVDQADWLRDAVNGYQVLAALADNVSIIGHSTGGTLGIYVASVHPVEHLILIGPNLSPTPNDVWRKEVLSQPRLGELITFLLPVFTKPVREGRVYPIDTLDTNSASRAFSYYSLPTHSLKEVWDLQSKVDIKEARFEHLTIIYGEHDLTVDNEESLMLLQSAGVPFSSKSFPNSGHNVLEDYDAEDAIDYVMQLLSK